MAVGHPGPRGQIVTSNVVVDRNEDTGLDLNFVYVLNPNHIGVENSIVLLWRGAFSHVSVLPYLFFLSF